MSIAVTDRITRGTNNTSPFALVDEDDISVSYISVTSTSDRDSLPAWKRRAKMLCYIKDDDLYYRLGNDVTVAGQVWTLEGFGVPDGIVVEDDIFTDDGYIKPELIQNVFLNDSFVVDSEAEQLALSTLTGNFVIRTDTGDIYVKLNNDDPAAMDDFALITYPGAVLSVNGDTGAVIITITDLIADDTSGFNTAVAATATITALSASVSDLQTDVTTLQGDLADKADLVSGTVPLAQLPYNFLNGLTRDTDDVKLGGELIESTEIDGVDTFDLTIIGIPTLSFSVSSEFSITRDNGVDDQTLIFDSTAGLRYLADISPTATNHSLITKQYTDQRLLGYALSDPNADRIFFWDDSTGHVEHLSLSSAFNITGTTLNFVGSVGATNFLALTDTPDSYSLQAGKVVVVTDLEDGLEFIDFPTSGWPLGGSEALTNDVTITGDDTYILTLGDFGTGDKLGAFYMFSADDIQFQSPDYILNVISGGRFTMRVNTGTSVSPAATQVGRFNILGPSFGSQVELAAENASTLYMRYVSSGTTVSQAKMDATGFLYTGTGGSNRFIVGDGGGTNDPTSVEFFADSLITFETSLVNVQIDNGSGFYVTMTGSNDILLDTASGNINITTAGGTNYITLGNAGISLVTDGADDITITANGEVHITSEGSGINFTGNISTFEGGQFISNTSSVNFNNGTVTMTLTNALLVTSDDIIQMEAANDIMLMTGANDYISFASGGITDISSSILTVIRGLGGITLDSDADFIVDVTANIQMVAPGECYWATSILTDLEETAFYYLNQNGSPSLSGIAMVWSVDGSDYTNYYSLGIDSGGIQIYTNYNGISNQVNPLLRYQTDPISTSDDILITMFQSDVLTTNNTATTIKNYSMPSNKSVYIIADIVSRRTGGAAGTAEDGAAYNLRALFKNVTGTATQIGSTAKVVVGESQAGWDADFTVATNVISLKVTGATDNDVSWHCARFEVIEIGG